MVSLCTRPTNFFGYKESISLEAKSTPKYQNGMFDHDVSVTVFSRSTPKYLNGMFDNISWPYTSLPSSPDLPPHLTHPGGGGSILLNKAQLPPLFLL